MPALRNISASVETRPIKTARAKFTKDVAPLNLQIKITDTPSKNDVIDMTDSLIKSSRASSRDATTQQKINASGNSLRLRTARHQSQTSN